MKYEKLEYYVSQQRLNRFLIAGGNSKTKAKKLYHANLRVCQSFYPVLNIFEVFLRNICYNHVAARFANPNWIITEKSGFMSDQSLKPSKFFLRNSVINTERNIIRKGGVPSAGKIMAEQTLGFWTSLFETHHYGLIGGVVIHSFPNKPAYVNRRILSQKLTQIREFRNRIYHNEPVCFNGHTIDFTIASAIKNEINDLLAWMDHDLPNYAKSFDNIENKIIIASRI